MEVKGEARPINMLPNRCCGIRLVMEPQQFFGTNQNVSAGMEYEKVLKDGAECLFRFIVLNHNSFFFVC